MRDDAQGDHRLSWLVVTDSANTIVQTVGTAPDAGKLGELGRLLADGIVHGDVVHARVKDLLGAAAR